MAQELDLEALLSEAELAVREAGLLFADRALTGHIHHKNATDFVTEVDTGVQELMRRRLAEILPEARFMGEEQDNIVAANGHVTEEILEALHNI